jgi:hypothetical protein
MARILALVAAVGLVAGAVVLRGAIDGRGDGPSAEPSLGVLWCDPLLADACAAAADGAEVKLIEPGDAFDRLSDLNSKDDPPALWVTAGDWSSMLAVANPNTEVPTFGTPAQVASTPLVVAAKGDNLKLLDVACPKTVTWNCLADATGKDATDLGGAAPLGEFRLGHVVPPSSAGLVTLAGLAGTIPDDDAPPDRDDVTSQAFGGLLGRIDSGELGVSSSSAVKKFTTTPGAASVLIAPEAEITGPATARGYEVRPVQPVVNLTAQVSARTTSPNDDAQPPSAEAVTDFTDRLGTGLTTAGWEPPSDADPTDPGLLAALLESWNAQ